MNTLGVDLAHLGDARPSSTWAARDDRRGGRRPRRPSRAPIEPRRHAGRRVGRPEEAVEEAPAPGVPRRAGLGRDYGVCACRPRRPAAGARPLGRGRRSCAPTACQRWRWRGRSPPHPHRAAGRPRRLRPRRRGPGPRAPSGSTRSTRSTAAVHEAQRALWLGQPEEARAAVDEGLGHIEGTTSTHRPAALASGRRGRARRARASAPGRRRRARGASTGALVFAASLAGTQSDARTSRCCEAEAETGAPGLTTLRLGRRGRRVGARRRPFRRPTPAGARPRRCSSAAAARGRSCARPTPRRGASAPRRCAELERLARRARIEAAVGDRPAEEAASTRQPRPPSSG